jgi:hypothetical protein
MGIYGMYRSLVSSMLLCLALGLILLAVLFLFMKISLSIVLGIALMGILLYIQTTYSYEIGDDGLWIKAPLQDTLISYQDIKDVRSSVDPGFVPYITLDDNMKYKFIRRGALYSKNTVLINTNTKMPLLSLTYTYILTPSDVEAFTTELRSKLKKI